MRSQHQSSSPQHVEQIGQQTLAVMNQRPSRLFFWKDPLSDFRAQLRNFVLVVKGVDPSEFSDEQFDAVDRLLTHVVSATERYLAQHIGTRDTVNCQAFGEAIRDLREAKEWIAQGLSPDPARRPSDETLRALGNEAAIRALGRVVPPKQPVLPI